MHGAVARWRWGMLRHGRHAGSLLDRRRHRRRCRPRRSAGVEEVLGHPGQRVEVVEEPALAVLPPGGLLKVFKLIQLRSIMNDLSIAGNNYVFIETNLRLLRLGLARGSRPRRPVAGRRVLKNCQILPPLQVRLRARPSRAAAAAAVEAARPKTWPKMHLE